jgi:TolB-like protein/Tfp pilus assembly protein PilF
LADRSANLPGSGAKDPLSQKTAQNPSERLESWKEIATYLRRGLRTVQRWEKQEGLPVHRLQHDERARVFAYKSELDSWLHSGHPRSEAEDETNVEPEAEQAAGVPAPASLISASPTDERVSRYRKVSWSLLGAAVPFAALWFVLAVYNHHSPQPQLAATLSQDRPALLVLPFSNLTGAQDQEYLADGLTEELISELGRLDADGLAVVARTTAMAFKHTNKTVAEIARELGVRYVLECSLREQNHRVRVTAQLVRASDQTNVWSGEYERGPENLLDLEDDLASDIASEVGLQLMPAQNAAGTAETRDPVALDEYLRGRFLLRTRSKEGLFRAVEHFHQAIERDPNYARAYAGLAQTYLVIGGGYMPASQAYRLAEDAALKSAQLNDATEDAHTALGYLKFINDMDWNGADREFKRALQLNPGDAIAHQWYAVFLAALNQTSEANKQIEKAIELDPLSVSANYVAGGVYCSTGQYDRAIGQYRRALELEPTSSAAHGGLALVYTYQQRYQDALREYTAAQRINGTIVQYAGPVADVYAQMNRRSDAKRTLLELKRVSKYEYVPSYGFVLAYAAVGDKDRAFSWLERATREREFTVTELNTDRRIDSLRRDPRFSRIRAAFRLPPQ